MVTKIELLESPESFDINERIIHFASGGGVIPKVVIEHYEDWLVINEYIGDLPQTTECIINPSLTDFVNLKNKTETSNYLSSFCLFTSRGLFSYDKTHIGKINNTFYHLVAKPAHQLDFKSLPINVQNLLQNFSIDVNMELYDIFSTEQL
jgi:hypothetical protein